MKRSGKSCFGLKSVFGLLFALAALMASGGTRADAATIDYIFDGTGSGTLGNTSFVGPFQISIAADTANVTFNGVYDYRNIGVTSFTAALLTANLSSGSQAILNSDPNGPAVGFGQTLSSSPFFVAEALVNPSLASYNLATSFGPISGQVSFQPQTFSTDQGDLHFSAISSLTFTAVTPAVLGTPGPIAGAGLVPLLGLAGAYLFGRKRLAA